METTIISGRVDARVKERANAYIQAAGLSVSDVIKTVWERIARTGELPAPIAAEEAKTEALGAWEEFLSLRSELSAIPTENDWLAALTPQQLKDLIAEGLVAEYEDL